MTAPLGRLVIYTRKMDEMADFYCRHFGFRAIALPCDRIVELRPEAGGAAILLHPAGKGQRQGQALVKLVFDVKDVAGFCAEASRHGLYFGAIHEADGYTFANTKDPSGNSVQVSNRAFARTDGP